MTLTNPLSWRVFCALAAAVLLPAGAFAHVTVTPKQSTPGAWEKYEIRVPNEKQVATTGLEVRFPAGLRIVSFEDKPGWTIEPLRNAQGAIVGARWSGQLPPERFVEFGVVAVNPKAGGELLWSAAQTYADGTVADWSGAAGSPKPAPRVSLRPAKP